VAKFSEVIVVGDVKYTGSAEFILIIYHCRYRQSSAAQINPGGSQVRCRINCIDVCVLSRLHNGRDVLCVAAEPYRSRQSDPAATISTARHSAIRLLTKLYRRSVTIHFHRHVSTCTVKVDRYDQRRFWDRPLLPFLPFPFSSLFIPLLLRPLPLPS